jgi:hypothetical protein
MPKAINILKQGFEKHYAEWRKIHQDAAPYDKIIHYAINGDEFGDPLTERQWMKVTKASRPTVQKWLPIIHNTIKEKGILSEPVADAIVSQTLKKQKG